LHSRAQLEDKHVQQIIAFAGTGHLRDGNAASAEFRDFLSHVPSNLLRHYADQCLQDGFSGSGFALQDILNEVGCRLGFHVTHGRYRGSPGQVGHDGCWRFPEGQTVIVEVKTTDTYRIDLDTLAGYRRALIQAGSIAEEKAFLEQAHESFIAFGCGSEEILLLIPTVEFVTWLDGMHITQREDRFYWHVHISKETDQLMLHRKKGFKPIELTKFLVPSSSSN
jgi:hypothetical protein